MGSGSLTAARGQTTQATKARRRVVDLMRKVSGSNRIRTGLARANVDDREARVNDLQPAKADRPKERAPRSQFRGLRNQLLLAPLRLRRERTAAGPDWAQWIFLNGRLPCGNAQYQIVTMNFFDVSVVVIYVLLRPRCRAGQTVTAAVTPLPLVVWSGGQHLDGKRKA
jgi:hypothetical protein